MNEKIKNYREISKNVTTENTKSLIKNKFGFIPKHHKISSDNVNNSCFVLSKTSISNTKSKKNNTKLKLFISGNNKKQINNDKKNSHSCKSLINNGPNVPVIKQKKLSRNYNQNYSSITNDNTNNTNTNTNTKYYSSFLNSKQKLRNSLHNNYNYSYSITNNDSQNHKSKKKISFDDYKSRKIKSYMSKTKNKYNEIVLNIKPIIKNENIINNQLWSKLITNIDKKQNDKINKLKRNYLNRVNININANININIKKEIVNYPRENNDITIDNKCNTSCNLINISNNNLNNITTENYNFKKYLPDISLNDITNCNPPEKDISTISLVNEENNMILSKENKNKFNKIIKEHIKENKEREKSKINEENKKNKKNEENKENKENKEINNINNKMNSSDKNSEKEKDKNNNTSNIGSIKKENNLRKLYSSSVFDDSHDEINDNVNKKALFKREIKYCDSETFKTSNSKSEKLNNEDKNEIENHKVINKENISDVNNPSFIGDNNSFHRVAKQIDEVSSEKDKQNKINNDSDFTESNKRNVFYYNNNNNIYGTNSNNNNNNNNVNNIQNNSENKSENFKIYRLLSKNYSYNVSTRDIHDEVAKKFNHENPNINYFFISEVEKKNKNIINLNKKKFLKLKDIPIFKILSFGIDNYLPLINSDIYIKNKINKSLYNIYENLILSFKFTYKDYLEVTHYRFEQNKVKSFYNDNSYILDLILNCKIISKSVERSVELSCNYSSNNKKYDYLWKFDLQKKTKINKWITTEINTMKNYYKTISYTSQVSSFSYGDEIQFQINLFNINNILEPSSVEWFAPVVSFINYQVYENTKFINNIPYDPLRACEVEKQILLWHDKFSKEQMLVFEEIKAIFEKMFKIKNIYFDKSKYSFYKIVMVPKKIGFLSRNKYCSFDINIIDYNIPAKNEIQCIYYINTNNYTNKMDIRLGNTLTLYIVDMGVN